MFDDSFKDHKLSSQEINTIITDIKQDQKIFGGRLLLMLELVEKQELACIIYSLHALYLKAIEGETSIDESQKTIERNVVNGNFKQLFEYFLQLQRIRSNVFDCDVPELLQFTELTQFVNNHVSDQPALNAINNRVSTYSKKAQSSFSYLITLTISLLWSSFFRAWDLYRKKQENSWRNLSIILALLGVMLPLLLLLISSRLYPIPTPINRLSSHLMKAIDCYMTIGRCTNRGISLKDSMEYGVFFQKNPDIKPQTLYEFAHKFLSSYDLLDKIPYQNLEKELLIFLKQTSLSDHQIKEQRLFPVQDFLNIKTYTNSFMYYIDWEDASSSNESVLGKASNKITLSLKHSSFYQLLDSTDDTGAAPLSVKAI